MKSKLSEKANNLPLLPGVYIMKDKTGQVIYVGKAKKLKNRVSSYFHGEHLPKVEAMISKIEDFDYIIVNSELEALVLENSLIKRHKPFYNILLKDDKGYPFIRIDTGSDYPSITLSNKMLKDKAMYFGPFGARNTTYEIIRSVKSALMLPDCSRKFPRDIGKERPCLNYHMKKCSGWCCDASLKDEYNKRINQAVSILQGHSAALTEDLKKEMQSASEALKFEYAAELRDRIKALEALQNKQRVFSTPVHDTDAVAFVRGAVCCLSVLKYIDGNLVEKDIEIVEEPVEEDEEAIAELLRQYYTRPGVIIPKVILVQVEPEFREELEKVLSDNTSHTVSIISPKRGEKLSLVETAVINASQEIIRLTSEAERKNNTLTLLKNSLNLDVFPNRIEAFDISNLGSTGIVAGMTVFINGNKSTKDYKRYRIDELETQNDFEAVYNAVKRRFKRAIAGDASFTNIPDLLLIDGGEIQVRFAEKALEELEIKIPVFGMVKDDRHRTRALVNSSGEEVEIKSQQALFSFIGNIQEETHRFAITYQKMLRNSAFTSVLDKIPGIGDKRKAALLIEFKSIKSLKAAELEDLKRILPSDAALSVYSFFHPEDHN